MDEVGLNIKSPPNNKQAIQIIGPEPDEEDEDGNAKQRTQGENPIALNTFGEKEGQYRPSIPQSNGDATSQKQ